jgi:integrase
VGVKVVTNRHGYLRFRIFWKGRDVAVSSKLVDDGARGPNRRLATAKAVLIEQRLREKRAIHEALLEILGDCPPRLIPEAPKKSTDRLATLREFAAWWLERLENRRERKSYLRKARSYTENVILPFWGDTQLSEVTSARLDDFQDQVLRRRTRSGHPIKVKTARNIVTGFFRAMIVEAMRRHGVPKPDPFLAGLRWPDIADTAEDEPDPFSAEERDAILDHYAIELPSWYPFLYFQFWTGCRPSETTALRETDVDLELGTVRIHRSRDEGEEATPKTKKSKRTIHLYPNVIEVLRERRSSGPYARPGYFFTDTIGEPVFARDWPEDHGFYDTLAHLGIRRRKFYATRHTFISWMLTHGANPFGIAQYCGTSLQMIEQRYGKWIPEKGLDPAVLEVLENRENRTLGRTLRAPG